MCRGEDYRQPGDGHRSFDLASEPSLGEIPNFETPLMKFLGRIRWEKGKKKRLSGFYVNGFQVLIH